MNSYAPMPYASAPYSPPPSYAPPSYAPPSYAPAPAYASPIPLTPLVIPDDADALGGGGGGGGFSITKFFALPLIVVLPILLPFLVILFFGPKFGKGNRRRREAEKNKQISSSNSALPSMSIAQVDRLTDVVFAAINSQECIQRLLCEAGTLSRSFAESEALTKAVKEFIPESIKDVYDVFAKAEKCEQYKCGSL
ncbi:uncharacterized protein LOC130689001 [Daphnia carinata]|uniref:uncharacterized protein LOC130689001 n=1 Tax=Daphnia carinata TaxID=120202 RepID=UPI00257C4EAA|nr:uncharacterized protein LOC130689001 [Daphnia carinata]